MTNKEVAKIFNRLAKVMELHGENVFKTRSYSGAYNTIRRYGEDVISLSHDQLTAIPGIGKNIADKIIELRDIGSLQTLERFLDMTPPGIVEMLDIKGVGPKKLLAIWKELGVESPGELIYACEENRLVELKGFGAKTQESIKAQLEYYLDSKGYYLYGHIEREANELLSILKDVFPGELFEFVGDVRRKMPIVAGIEVLTTANASEIEEMIAASFSTEEESEHLSFKGTQVTIIEADPDSFYQMSFEGSAAGEFLDEWFERYGDEVIEEEDEDLFHRLDLGYIPAESRETPQILDIVAQGELDIIDHEDVKGVVHTHSIWSDGSATVLAMAEASKSLGYEYLVMSDHSQSAFYAGGLKPDQVLAQMDEIDKVNKCMTDFHVYKGIECDILNDGGLDYDDELLSRFDIVIASIHSNLKMEQSKAMNRLLTAIAHPATRILGHMTGRLLLSRKGYPIDHKEIIDACAEHDVVIELNASPYRLDMDWTWIPYAIEKGVMISINPDAHSVGGIKDIKYGVLAARKAVLSPEMCLNAKAKDEFDEWLSNKKG